MGERGRPRLSEPEPLGGTGAAEREMAMRGSDELLRAYIRYHKKYHPNSDVARLNPRKQA